MSKDNCCCPCHKMNGILIALIGLLFLLANMGFIAGQIFSLGWPVLLIILGLCKAFKGSCACCTKGSCKKEHA